MAHGDPFPGSGASADLGMQQNLLEAVTEQQPGTVLLLRRNIRAEFRD